MQGPARILQAARERTPSTVTVECASGIQRARVKYFVTPKPGSKHRLVFCLTDSNGDAASKDFATSFTFTDDGGSPSLDDQAAAAIAGFVKKKVDKGELVLPDASSPLRGLDPMEVESPDPSGACFRL